MLVLIAIVIVAVIRVPTSNPLILQMIAFGTVSYLYSVSAQRRSTADPARSVLIDIRAGCILYGAMILAGCVQLSVGIFLLGALNLALIVAIRNDRLPLKQSMLERFDADRD